MCRQVVSFCCESARVEVNLRKPLVIEVDEHHKLRSFCAVFDSLCNRLMEYAARRFAKEIDLEESELWRRHCSSLRNSMLNSSSVLLSSLAGRIDWALNEFDEIVEGPLTSGFADAASLHGWLKKVETFFQELSLLLAVCRHWLASPAKLRERLESAGEIVEIAVELKTLTCTSLIERFKLSRIAEVAIYSCNK